MKYLATRARSGFVRKKEAAFRGAPPGRSRTFARGMVCAGAEVWPTPAAPLMISASNLSALSSMPALACVRVSAPLISRRRLCAVAAQKGAFVEEQDAAAVLEDGVRGGEPREASADDDDLFGHDASFPSSEDLRRDACVVPSRGPRTYKKATI